MDCAMLMMQRLRKQEPKGHKNTRTQQVEEEAMQGTSKVQFGRRNTVLTINV